MDDLLQENIKNLEENLEQSFKEILEKENFVYTLPTENSRSQYLYLNFHFIRQLLKVLQNSPEEMLSVQQTKIVTNIFRNIVGVGIASLLLPSMNYTALPSDKYCKEEPVDVKYNRLIFTLYELYICMQSKLIKPIITTNYFKYILSALYQVLYCKVKKPSLICDDKTDFQMTDEFYARILENRKRFAEVFNYCKDNVFKTIYLRETMMLLKKNSPKWLNVAVASNLNEAMGKSKGVESLVSAMLDVSGTENPDDTTRTWKIVSIISRIIVDSRNSPDFEENICKQVIKLLDLDSEDSRRLYPFEQVFSLCTKQLYCIERDKKYTQILVNKVFEFFQCSIEEPTDLKKDVTKEIRKGIRILHMCFCNGVDYAPELPASLLFKYIAILFRIYVVVLEEEQFVKFTELLKEVLYKILTYDDDQERIMEFFNATLFERYTSRIIAMDKNMNIFIENDSSIYIQNVEQTDITSLSIAGNTTLVLLGNNFGLKRHFFQFLLNTLTHENIYFNLTTQRDLQSKQMVVGLICALLQTEEDSKKLLLECQESILNYFKTLLENAVLFKLYTKENFDINEIQHLFGFFMVIQLMVDIVDKNTIHYYEPLIENLQIISNKSKCTELKTIATDILLVLNNFQYNKKNLKKDAKEITNFEKALQDVFDPLLPIRGHGLLSLAKLLEQKDEETMKKKQYLLNIFQQFLKDEDSFIYLNAIRGLAALGDIFPDTVLEVLCEEYVNYDKESKADGHEIPIKIGETLVQITRTLGKMASKHKSILLNTFLHGAKNEDHLLRASSLSNLGAVCQALRFGVGTIITEVLTCVHGVITTDKAPEPRRAAVHVLRQIFVGLGKEMILILKDEILFIYRSLKNIYQNDVDDVVRLQAQLCLEELNANMMEFIFPQPQLHSEKKVIELK
ncbi:uncharacterized protein LOC108735101 isoform X2 [Agrilus planipennis]|nr:uncharacterized protein LOC108735101 isoform X2 [Agrilus planipennis]